MGPADRGRGTRHEDDAVPATDVLVTTAPGVTLVILVADCLPLALVDPAARVLAVVARRAGGAPRPPRSPAAVRAMVQHGARPERLRAFLGPAVAPERYQVGDEVRRALAHAVHPDALGPAVARPDGPGHWLVDLVAANRQQLLRSGRQPAPTSPTAG